MLTLSSLVGRDLSNRLPLLSKSRLHPTEHDEQAEFVSVVLTGTGLYTGTLSKRAPVGQTAIHWPQDIQSVSLRFYSIAGFTIVSNPLLTSPSAVLSITSSHIRTH